MNSDIFEGCVPAHYRYETRADLFFELRREFPNLVGFKEFGRVTR
jgi:4-hydroxy-tetrahydrodipicolinate synthase